MDLLTHIKTLLDEPLGIYDGAMVVIGGNFNMLDVAELTTGTGLIPLVHVSTRNNNILDMVMASPSAPYNVTVINAAVKTEHAQSWHPSTGKRLKNELCAAKP